MRDNAYERTHAAWFVEGDCWRSVDETVACEVPVEIYYGRHLAGSVSCTPQDLHDLAYGYLLTIDVIKGADDIAEVLVTDGANGLEIRAVPSVPSVEKDASYPKQNGGLSDACDYAIPVEAVHKASASLLDVQAMHRSTGATHAAAFVSPEGRFLYLREDIGRHNAVDKLIGAMMRDRVDPLSGFVHLSSRCALDLVEKCSKYGIRLISTVSAPTTAVLEFAEERTITLCAFARSGHFTVYTHPENLL